MLFRRLGLGGGRRATGFTRWIHGVGGRLFAFWLGAAETVLEQMQNLVLHPFKLVQLEVGVLNLEQIPGLAVLIYENPLAVARQLGLHLEDALSFQHG